MNKANKKLKELFSLNVNTKPYLWAQQKVVLAGYDSVGRCITQSTKNSIVFVCCFFFSIMLNIQTCNVVQSSRYKQAHLLIECGLVI